MGDDAGDARWNRRLLDEASIVLDNVLHPLVNMSSSEESREDAFHDKVIKVRPPPGFRIGTRGRLSGETRSRIFPRASLASLATPRLSRIARRR